MSEALRLLGELVDPNDCRFDHNGDCQEHGFSGEGECPHAAAKRLLSAKQGGEIKGTRLVYATPDGQHALRLDVPFGMIAPPTLEMHDPSSGSLTFYRASLYSRARRT